MYGTTYAGGTDGAGTVYEATPSDAGWTVSVIYSFSGGSSSTACLPTSGVVLDSAGNLYGTADQCGIGNQGSVYRLTPSAGGWTETTLHEFTGGSDGAQPYGGLLLDASGNLYGTTIAGGVGNTGVVFELTQSNGTWAFQTIYSFTGCCGGSWAAVTMDRAGNLYGTTRENGAYEYGNVFELTPTTGGWVYTSLHDFNPPYGGGYPYSPVTIDSSGNLYGTTSEYGNDGEGTVWEITP